MHREAADLTSVVLYLMFLYRAEQGMLSLYSYYANLLFSYHRPPAMKKIYISIACTYYGIITANIISSPFSHLPMLTGMGPMRLISSFIE